MEGFLVILTVWISSFSDGINENKFDENSDRLINKQEFVNWADNSCLKCHDSLMTQKRKHVPAKEDCSKCHIANGNEHPLTGTTGFNYKQPVADLCFSCHEVNTKKNLHQPSKDGQCIDCHSPHSSKNKKLLKEKKSANLCKKCHQLDIKEEDNVHNPVSSGRCHKCHDPHQSDFDSFLKNDMPSLCYKCHDGIEEEMKLKRVHSPAKEDCFKCHDAHSNKQSYLLPDTIPNLCYSCHSDIKSKKNIHAPARDGKCKSCHATHGSKNKKLLKNKKSAIMCNECHQLGLKEDDIVHNPVSSGRCHKCHDAHQSNYDFYLKEGGQDLCYKCHSEVEDRIDTSAFIHKALNEKKACTNCHSPHASPENVFLIKKEKELCLSCHNKTYTTKEGKVSNIKQLLSRSKTVHSPVNQGCLNCHKPHSSEVYALLADEFPQGEYAFARKGSFALCFNCHSEAIIEVPLSDTITNFRNGKENLHYVHIQGKKGRNCNICHNVHASVNNHLISSETSFGDWKMNMNYISMEHGGSCNNGCHAETKYDRTQRTINNPDFNITSIKKYNNYVDDLKKIRDKSETKKKDKVEPENRKVESENVLERKVIVAADTTEVDPQVEDSQLVIENEEVTEMPVDSVYKGKNIEEGLIIENEKELIEENTADLEQEKYIVTVDSVAEKKQIKEEKIVKSSNINTEKKEVGKAEIKTRVGKKNIEAETEINKKNQLVSETKNNIEKTKEEEEQIVNPNLEFVYAKTVIKKGMEQQFIRLVEYLKKHPEQEIEVHGHTDILGSNRYNYFLSRKRAEKLKKMLIEKGIDASRIRTMGHGAKRPVASNQTDEGRAKNRRVEIKTIEE